MFYRTAADLVLVTHLAFVILVVAGAVLVFRYPWFAWIHVPVATWGAYVELTGRICPLTTLENYLRINAGQEGWLLNSASPAKRNVQLWLAGLVVAINVILYAWILLRKRSARQNDAKK